MKIAICNELFQDWPIEKVFTRVAEIGYQGVEIAPFTLAKDAREISAQRRVEIRNAARASGVEIAGLHWLLVQPPGMLLNGPDAEVRRRTEQYLEALIDLCADLDGRILVFGSPNQRKVQPGDKWSDAWRRSVEVFQRLAERAQNRNTIIAIEPLAARDGCNFINTVGEGTLLVEAVGLPAFRLHLDAKAMSGEGRPVEETIRLEGGKYLVHFHANDPNGRGPGMGELSFAPIIAALREIKYDGWISVEVFDYAPGAEHTAEISLKTLKSSGVQ